VLWLLVLPFSLMLLVLAALFILILVDDVFNGVVSRWIERMVPAEEADVWPPAPTFETSNMGSYRNAQEFRVRDRG